MGGDCGASTARLPNLPACLPPTLWHNVIRGSGLSLLGKGDRGEGQPLGQGVSRHRWLCSREASGQRPPALGPRHGESRPGHRWGLRHGSGGRGARVRVTRTRHGSGPVLPAAVGGTHLPRGSGTTQVADGGWCLHPGGGSHLGWLVLLACNPGATKQNAVLSGG